MAADYNSELVEVTGQIVCELIKKGLLPKELLDPSSVSVKEYGNAVGSLYQTIWKAMANAGRQ